MTDIEAQEILDTCGPWKIRVNPDQIQFENNQGDVLTLDLWTEPGYPDCQWDIVKDWTLGIRV